MSSRKKKKKREVCLDQGMPRSFLEIVRAYGETIDLVEAFGRGRSVRLLSDICSLLSASLVRAKSKI